MVRRRSNRVNRARHRNLLSFINKPSEEDISKHVELDKVNESRKEHSSIVIDGVKIILKSPPEEEYELNLVLDIEDSDEIKRGYLMSIEYDGEKGKALAIFYNDEEQKLYFWYDKTGHKPYFLTDIPPDNIMKLRDIVNHKSFEGVEVVKKIDLLRGVQRYLTKVIVKDPLAVRYLRNRVPTAWEADIKYHINYVYDLQLVPGMLYRVQGARMKLIELIDASNLKNIIDTVLGKEVNKDLIKTATELARLFETKPPKIPRIAVDIEVYTPLRSRVPSPNTVEFPIISIALVNNEGLRRVLVLYRDEMEVGDLSEIPSDVEVEFFDSERGLMIECFKTLNTYPLVLTFNGDNFDLPYLHNRALKLGIPQDLIP
ncbi:MAG: type B DNA-directed DNA polymerase, partial [Thermoprotei archaeon]